jgi:heme oxygenase
MSLTIAPPSVAQLLKQETIVEHREAEQLLAPRLNDIKTRDDYASVLYLFYGFYFPLEQLIESNLDAELREQLGSRRQSGLILRDLASLDRPYSHIPICTNLPAVDSGASALGALYVLEGSTLGGQVIKRMLLQHTSAGLNEEHLQFFSGYREETGRRWQAFQQLINQYPGEQKEMAEGARSTFHFLSKWILHSVYGKN